MLLYALIQSIFFKDRRDFWSIKLKGILLGISIIPVLFYIYNGVIGKSPDWLNIAILFIAAALAHTYEAIAFIRNKKECISKWLALAVIFAIALFFVLFTFKTPELGIFRDPLTGSYGI